MVIPNQEPARSSDPPSTPRSTIGWVERSVFVTFHDRAAHEIQTHKWIESEKAGYDIGFARARRDWLQRHAKDFQRHFLQQSHA